VIRLKFSEFISGTYDRRGERHVVYVLIAESYVLYVGMSKANIWMRWFGQPASHMFQYSDKQWGYQSPAGEAVVRCLPDSLNWTIELWTAGDCTKFLEKDKSLERLNPNDIHELEWLLIDKLHPVLNVSGVSYIVSQGDLPEFIRKYKQADDEDRRRTHQEIFNRTRVRQ
jgi:hypothetical protein